MEKSKLRRGLVLLLLLLVLVGSLIVLFSLAEKIIDRLNGTDSLNYTDTGKAQLYYGGNCYTFDENKESILVMGIDSIVSENSAASDSLQADFVALVIIDKLDHEFSVLHINRDTMTEITQLDDKGNKYGTYEAQLALAHTYGGDGKIQCRNTVAAVENLLYNIDINHYISFTMDAIPIVNDGVGGVTLTLEHDLSELGDEFVKGALITLKGDDALKFVRYRNYAPTTSNLERMERQRQYITAFVEQYSGTEADSALEILTDISEYVVSDLTANQFSVLFERLQTYAYEGTLTLEGEAVKTDKYVEYYVDDTAAQKTVIDLFYKIEE